MPIILVSMYYIFSSSAYRNVDFGKIPVCQRISSKNPKVQWIIYLPANVDGKFKVKTEYVWFIQRVITIKTPTIKM